MKKRKPFLPKGCYFTVSSKYRGFSKISKFKPASNKLGDFIEK